MDKKLKETKKLFKMEDKVVLFYDCNLKTNAHEKNVFNISKTNYEALMNDDTDPDLYVVSNEKYNEDSEQFLLKVSNKILRTIKTRPGKVKDKSYKLTLPDCKIKMTKEQLKEVLSDNFYLELNKKNISYKVESLVC